MCGRFAQIDPIAAVSKTFFIDEIVADLAPRYNIAPGQNILAVFLQQEKRILTQFKWGLVPSWAKDPAIGYKMINARSETVFEKPSYRQAIKSRRCLIVANGFYEWKQLEGQKIAYYIYLKNRPLFAFAGLFEHWQSPEGEVLDTCTILTTGSNNKLAAIHNRMPVILPRGGEQNWLTPGAGREALFQLLQPYPLDDMELYEVSPYVNSSRNNSPQCIERV